MALESSDRLKRPTKRPTPASVLLDVTCRRHLRQRPATYLYWEIGDVVPGGRFSSSPRGRGVVRGPLAPGVDALHVRQRVASTLCALLECEALPGGDPNLCKRSKFIGCGRTYGALRQHDGSPGAILYTRAGASHGCGPALLERVVAPARHRLVNMVLVVPVGDDCS